MRKVNIVKRGNVFQYQFEIAQQGRKRKFKSKLGVKISASAFGVSANIKAVSKRLGQSIIQTVYNVYEKVTEKIGTDTVDTLKNYSHSMGISNIKE